MITMRLFAEEKRTGTIELLATSPVSDVEVILGKWLSAVILYASMLLLTAERDRKSTRLNSSHQIISYAVFCLKKKKKRKYLQNRQEPVPTSRRLRSSSDSMRQPRQLLEYPGRRWTSRD